MLALTVKANTSLELTVTYAGNTNATIDDVAKRAHVSAMTVSRYLNDTGPVAAKTAQRIHAAIVDLNYIPHQGARALAARKTNTIGLILPEMNDIFFFQLIRGVQQAIAGQQIDLLLYSAATRGKPDVLNLPLGPHNTDGLLVFTDSLDETTLRRLHAKQFPIVMLYRTPPADLEIPTVLIENRQGAYDMVTHLVRCGHNRIAFLAGSADNEDAVWREAGYREALAAHELALISPLCASADFDEAAAANVVTHWLATGQEMDAIFAADDVSAHGAIRAVQAAGLGVPDDIAVVGFDDALLSQYIDPPLTTVRAPTEEAGRRAAAQLLRLIEGDSAELLTLLPTEIIIRQSCGWLSSNADTSQNHPTTKPD